MCQQKEEAKSKIDAVINSLDRLSAMIEQLLAARAPVGSKPGKS